MQCCWFNSSFFVDAKRLSDQLGFVAFWFPCYGLSYLFGLGITWDLGRNPQPARGLRVATMALFNQEEGTKLHSSQVRDGTNIRAGVR